MMFMPPAMRARRATRLDQPPRPKHLLPFRKKRARARASLAPNTSPNRRRVNRFQPSIRNSLAGGSGWHGEGVARASAPSLGETAVMRKIAAVFLFSTSGWVYSGGSSRIAASQLFRGLLPLCSLDPPGSVAWGCSSRSEPRSAWRATRTRSSTSRPPAAGGSTTSAAPSRRSSRRAGPFRNRPRPPTRSSCSTARASTPGRRPTAARRPGRWPTARSRSRPGPGRSRRKKRSATSSFTSNGRRPTRRMAGARTGATAASS